MTFQTPSRHFIHLIYGELMECEAIIMLGSYLRCVLHTARISNVKKKILLLWHNRPLALRGHVTNACFKQWVGILLMPKIDRVHKNYPTLEIWGGNAFKGDILWHFDFSTKQYDLYWPPCWRACSCPPTWRPKLLFACNHAALQRFWKFDVKPIRRD